MGEGFSPEEFEREIRRRIGQMMRELSREVSRAVDSALKTTEPVIGRIREEMDYFVPDHEAYLDGDDIVVVIQIPGASKDSIDASVTGRDLAVVAGFSEELKENAPRARLFRSKGYRCLIELPREADPSAAKAVYRDSVLVLRLPVHKPKGVEIKIE